MEAAFENLKKEGKNTVDGLVDWMKSAKLIDGTKEAEDKVRKLFEGVKDKKDVELEKFKEVVNKVAEECHKNVEEFTKQLADHVPKFTNAVKAAATAATSAFLNTFTSKK